MHVVSPWVLLLAAKPRFQISLLFKCAVRAALVAIRPLPTTSSSRGLVYRYHDHILLLLLMTDEAPELAGAHRYRLTATSEPPCVNMRITSRLLFHDTLAVGSASDYSFIRRSEHVCRSLKCCLFKVCR